MRRRLFVEECSKNALFPIRVGNIVLAGGAPFGRAETGGVLPPAALTVFACRRLLMSRPPGGWSPCSFHKLPSPGIVHQRKLVCLMSFMEKLAWCLL